LNTDLNQMQRLRTSGAISLLAHCAFMASTGKLHFVLFACFVCIVCVCLNFLYIYFFFSLYIILYRAYSCSLLSHLVQDFHWYLANPVLVRVLLNTTDTLHEARGACHTWDSSKNVAIIWRPVRVHQPKKWTKHFPTLTREFFG
jgi:hypothetical protein